MTGARFLVEPWGLRRNCARTALEHEIIVHSPRPIVGDVPSPLLAWQSFYVMVGSSAAALTGLQFVVAALIAQADVKGQTGDTSTFGTPTVVHFCAALLIAAIVNAPWRTVSSPAVVLGSCGVVGFVYALIITARARHTTYRPVLEDWIWHSVLPLIAYASLVVSALLLERDTAAVLFLVAAAALSLLFIGIHNAWDTVMYIAIDWTGVQDKR